MCLPVLSFEERSSQYEDRLKCWSRILLFLFSFSASDLRDAYTGILSRRRNTSQGKVLLSMTQSELFGLTAKTSSMLMVELRELTSPPTLQGHRTADIVADVGRIPHVTLLPVQSLSYLLFYSAN